MFFRVFRHYLRKTLCKLPVLLRLSSNLQGNRPLKRKRCENNKKDKFSLKKFKFWAKNRRKIGFFGVFRHFFKKTPRKFLVLLRLSSNLQGRRLFDCKRWPNNKKDHFARKKNKFWAKKRRNKNRFFGVFRYYFSKTLRKIAVLLRLRSNLQGSRPFDCRMCANKKNGHFYESKLSFRPKNFKKNVFFKVFRYYSRKTLRKFAVKLPLSLNLQGSRII